MIRCFTHLKRLNLLSISSRLSSSDTAPSGVPYKSLKNDDVASPVSVPTSADVVII
ncbi:hypothetical protein NPIL_110651, partial [Nephila pilipes]